jgi:hypothetical protein
MTRKIEQTAGSTPRWRACGGSWSLTLLIVLKTGSHRFRGPDPAILPNTQPGHRSDVGCPLQGAFLRPHRRRPPARRPGRTAYSRPTRGTGEPCCPAHGDTIDRRLRTDVLGCIDIDHPRVAVLSYQEIDPSFTIHPVGEIKAGGLRASRGPRRVRAALDGDRSMNVRIGSCPEGAGKSRRKTSATSP